MTAVGQRDAVAACHCCSLWADPVLCKLIAAWPRLPHATKAVVEPLVRQAFVDV